MLGTVGRELRLARLDRDLSLCDVASAVGCSASTVSRIERGLVGHVSFVDLAALHAVVGLDLSVRSYPGGQPIRDRAQLALLSRLRARLHPSLRWATEVPLPIAGDRRAWDAAVSGDGWRTAVEAESGPRDGQALVRRITLKLRDSAFEAVVLLLPNTARTRAFLRAAAVDLAGLFLVPGPEALACLAAGTCPRGNAIIVL